MERSHVRTGVHFVAITLLAIPLITSSGCMPMLATGMYLWEGGNLVDAECKGLENERVVVVCRPPSSHEYRHAGASREVSERVSDLLVKNVKKIDVVDPREVDNWIDQSDWGDFKGLATAVHADKVVYIELNNFELYKGKTLYQGDADVTVNVYDMKNSGKIMWDKQIGQILYPTNSGIPAQDKPPQQFEREFCMIVADRIAENFYRHDPNKGFALDALANH